VVHSDKMAGSGSEGAAGGEGELGGREKGSGLSNVARRGVSRCWRWWMRGNKSD
jgi:hypothetical protein